MNTVISPVRYRYSLAASEIESRTPNILDVGGYQSRRIHLQHHFDALSYTSLNIGPAWYKNDIADVIFDGVDIPFADNQFEYVISVDTLEHVPLSHRQRLIEEMYRVASKSLILVCPYDNGQKIHERYIRDYCELFELSVPFSLQEHLKFGLPTANEIATYFAQKIHRIHFRTNKHLYWAFQFAMLINCRALGDKAESANLELHSLMEATFAQMEESVDFSNSYRMVIVTSKENSTQMPK